MYIAEVDYEFARTHTFALLAKVIAWACRTNCTVFFMQHNTILVDFFHFKFVLDNFCSCYYSYIASLTSY